MVTAHIRAHRKDEGPIDFRPPGGMVHAIDNTTFIVMEGGMASGEPSVMILAISPKGIGVAVEQSLDKFLMAAQGMTAFAEQWGWTRPEGYATLMPPDKAVRRALLESIKKELEEWDESNPD